MRCWLPIMLAGCGRIGFAPLSDPPGDGPDVAADVANDGGTFSTPVPIAELNSTSEDDDPTLTDDELEIFFVSNRPGSMGQDIWRSQRASTSDPWDPPTNVTELNTADTETTPELTSDGLTMFFGRGTLSDSDIFVTTRATRGAPWSQPIPVTELASNEDDTAPATSPDQLTMVLTRGVVQVNARLLLATRASLTDPWSTPVVVLDDPGRQENQAWLGENDIYYTINTPGLQTIFRAVRTGPTTFGPAIPIPELDLAGSQSDPWLPASQRAIYFEHEDDLYVARR